MKNKNYFSSFGLISVILQISLLSGLAQTNRRWLSIDPKAKPGDPIRVEVISALSEGTELKISLTGLWTRSILIGDKSYYELEWPEVRYSGQGYPTGRTLTGWWDFPDSQKQVRRPSDAFTSGQTSVRQSTFPASAVGQTPRTEEEMRKLGIDPSGARPGLPRLRALLALSLKHDRDEITVESKAEGTSIRLKLDQPVAPAGFEGSDQVKDDNTGYSAPRLIDENFYKTFRGKYQGAEEILSEVGNMGPFSGATLAYPLITLEDPSTLVVNPIYFVYVKHLRGTEDFTCPIPWDHWIFSMPFINGQAIRDSLTVKGLAIEASRSARYLILCPKDWRPQLNGLALWKQAKGLNVDFMYVGAGGDIAADRNTIDAAIEAYFRRHYCHGVYVLICGDQDVIPAGRSVRVDSAPDAANADSDQVYEVIGNSLFPSVYVGRLSANSTAELEVQLSKILTYERHPVPGDWPRRATLCANSQMDNGNFGVNAVWPTKYSKAVEDTVNYGSYVAPPIFQTLHAGAATSGVTRAINADVVAALNAGRGQVLYRGHGDGDSWTYGWDGSGGTSSIGTGFNAYSNVAALTNAVQPIVYSIACQNSRINRSDCIAERWMSQSGGGAVAHFGASVNSYTSENHERTKGIFRAIYQEGYTRLGPMLARAEAISYATSGGGAGWENNTFAYILLGDPEMEIRRRAVPGARFTGQVLTTLIASNLGSLITISNSDNKPIPGAFVQVTKPDGRRMNFFASPEGTVEFSAVPPDQIARLDVIADGFPFNVIFLQAPALEPMGFVRGGFKVRLKNTPDGIFRVYGSSSMTARTWQDLGQTTPTGLDQEFIDTEAPTGIGARRFYRAEQVLEVR